MSKMRLTQRFQVTYTVDADEWAETAAVLAGASAADFRNYLQPDEIAEHLRCGHGLFDEAEGTVEVVPVAEPATPDAVWREYLTPDAVLVVEASGNVVLVTPERRITITDIMLWIDQLTTARTIAGALVESCRWCGLPPGPPHDTPDALHPYERYRFVPQALPGEGS